MPYLNIFECIFFKIIAFLTKFFFLIFYSVSINRRNKQKTIIIILIYLLKLLYNFTNHWIFLKYLFLLDYPKKTNPNEMNRSYQKVFLNNNNKFIGIVISYLKYLSHCIIIIHCICIFDRVFRNYGASRLSEISLNPRIIRS